MSITLRPDQEKALADIRVAFSRHRRVLLQASTGFGKTATASVIIRQAVAKGRRVVFAAHLDSIVGDTLERLRACGVYAGRIQAGEPADPLAPVQVASIATLHARELAPPADLVIADECHRGVSEMWRGTFGRYPRARILGLSATPQRADGAALGEVFDALVQGPSMEQLVALGVLVPCEVIAPPEPQDALAMSPVEALGLYAVGRPALVFCQTVAEARALAEQLGPRAACVDGETSIDQRRRDLRRFADGHLDVVTNCMVLTEGFDAPRAEVIVLARGCDHVGTFLQIVGRGLRAFPCKRVCTLVDLRGAVHRHGLPNEPRVWSLTGRAAARTSPIALRTCPSCFGVFAPRPTCPRCGHEFPAPPPTEVKPAAMSRVDQRAAEIREAIRQRGEVEMRTAYARLAREAEERGYSPKWAAMRFMQRFKLWPPASITRGAA